MHKIPVSYWMAKLSHSGVTGYTRYEGFDRKVRDKSKENLKGYLRSQSDEQSADVEPEMRTLNKSQSRKVKRYCQKLAYYSANRQVERKTDGKKFRFKVAFLTLTTPPGTTDEQSLQAFDGMLDYLRRTANCVFVWKKELGEKSQNLHYHLLINNFIPYYIVSWKWKRLLINQGVQWPLNEKGVHTDSHYRIESPKNRKQVAAYISKYLSKAHYLPRKLGYIAGHSAVLDNCKEIELFPDEYDYSEINAIAKIHYTIYDEYYTHICCNLNFCKKIAPGLHAVFKSMYEQFVETLTFEQKFNYI
jgi:hypothetical protein